MIQHPGYSICDQIGLNAASASVIFCAILALVAMASMENQREFGAGRSQRGSPKARRFCLSTASRLVVAKARTRCRLLVSGEIMAAARGLAVDGDWIWAGPAKSRVPLRWTQPKTGSSVASARGRQDTVINGAGSDAKTSDASRLPTLLPWDRLSISLG